MSDTTIHHSGSCLCGQIAFKVVGQPKFTTLCHCSNCKKWGGSGFAWNAAFSREVHFTKGESLQKVYGDSATTTGGTIGRNFCPNCGSHTMNTGTLPDGTQICAVPAGVIDDDISDSWKPQMELFCRSRASWLPDTDVVQHDTVPFQDLAAKISTK